MVVTIQEVLEEMYLDMDDIREILKKRREDGKKVKGINEEKKIKWQTWSSYGFLNVLIKDSEYTQRGFHISAFEDKIEMWEGYYISDFKDEIEPFKMKWVEPE